LSKGPGRVLSVEPGGGVACVDVGGVVREINVGFLLDDPPAIVARSRAAT
jgi:hydrogenase maturation factor